MTEERDITKCLDCGEDLSQLWIEQGRPLCARCHYKRVGKEPLPEIQEDKGATAKTKEIRGFYHGEIREMRKLVSLSRKGKPRKQAWGFHIEKG